MMKGRHRERLGDTAAGGFPQMGSVVQIGACELRVEEMDGRRVARLKVTKRDEPTAS